ncbi:unnamed protein product [marine sediment metagenome]|uniref:Uncharacterized protein n=1 Tax=marine sediment metagenome TaxID=412755 RepID=X1S1N8_9ZZZZ
MQTYKWDEHYKYVDISAVDIAPENRYRHNEPYIQHVSICGKDKYEQKDSH